MEKFQFSKNNQTKQTNKKQKNPNRYELEIYATKGN